MRIVDNALLTPDFKNVQSIVLDKMFPWFYARKAYEDEDIPNPYLKGWVHNIIPDNAYKSPLNPLLSDLIKINFERHGEPVENIWRLRAISNTIAPEPYLTGVHADFKRPHKTAILYINDADGDTVIFKEQWSENYERDASKLTIAQRITPKANRIVFFNGLQLHTGTIPTKNFRVAININYI
jgi:hypothetical protein